MTTKEIWYTYAQEVAKKHQKFEEKIKGLEFSDLSYEEREERKKKLRFSFLYTVTLTNTFTQLLKDNHENEIVFKLNKKLIKKFHCTYIKLINNKKESHLFANKNGYVPLFHMSTMELIDLEFKKDKQVETAHKAQANTQQSNYMPELQIEWDEEEEVNNTKVSIAKKVEQTIVQPQSMDEIKSQPQKIIKHNNHKKLTRAQKKKKKYS